MKFTFLVSHFLFPILLLVSSCSNENDQLSPAEGETFNSGTIEFKVNEEQVKFNLAAAAISNIEGGLQLFTISGGEDPLNPDIFGITLFFTIYDGEIMSIVSYPAGDTNCDDETGICFNILYNRGDEIFSLYDSNGNEGEGSIVFSSIEFMSGGRVRGEFSAMGYNELDRPLNFSEGKFNVEIF